MNMHQQWLKALDGDTDKVAENIRYAMVYSDNWEKLDFIERSRFSSIANALARVLTMAPGSQAESWRTIALLAAEAGCQIHRPADVAAALEQAAGILPKTLACEVRSEARRQRKPKAR